MKRTLRKNAGACPTPWTSSASVSTTPTPSPTRACCCLHADRAADIEQAADALIDLGERPGAAHPGRKPLALVHANDSLDPPGAARDRHCPIGDGTIGEDGFAALLAHPGIAGVPVVTETTGDPVQMARDVACLRRLRDAARG